MSDAAFELKPENSNGVPTQPTIEVSTKKYGVITMKVFERDQLMQAISHAFATTGIIYTRCDDGEQVYYWSDVHILGCTGYAVSQNYAGDKIFVAAD